MRGKVTGCFSANEFKKPLFMCKQAIKVDIGMEIDLGSALGINKDECPQLLFIKNGKGLYRLKGSFTNLSFHQLFFQV